MTPTRQMLEDAMSRSGKFAVKTKTYDSAYLSLDVMDCETVCIHCYTSEGQTVKSFCNHYHGLTPAEARAMSAKLNELADFIDANAAKPHEAIQCTPEEVDGGESFTCGCG